MTNIARKESRRCTVPREKETGQLEPITFAFSVNHNLGNVTGETKTRVVVLRILYPTDARRR